MALFIMYFGRSAPLIFSDSCGMRVNLAFHKKNWSVCNYQ